MTRPTDALLAALARRCEATQTHPWPELVPHPRLWCRCCRRHLAAEAGAATRPDLCVVCEGEG